MTPRDYPKNCCRIAWRNASSPACSRAAYVAASSCSGFSLDSIRLSGTNQINLMKLHDHDRDDDCDNAVTEGFQSALAHQLATRGLLLQPFSDGTSESLDVVRMSG